ncbi:hypothetical protein [Microbacterium lacticum]|uniref:Uncharacterized protein n=1 Tax=Microbacterium lacticum TaxID=33885 RepID=A0A4Y3UHH5_9MICO|nr:hypothetical protein [Microbacterium lacticum]TQN00431.1 hypothetical protein FHX68_0525 [Microbacterium lacticum]GEB94381.1 hypothetical protein MLA01_06000 [Microbacterium lacticum]GGN17961.1 hypothetical protein GCM10009724_09700 [Microbacterium lacticum]
MTNINVPIPEDVTPEEEEALINAAIDKRINDDVDDMLSGFGG